MLLAASDALAGRAPDEGVVIDRLPFVVGRRPASDKRPPSGAVQLELEDTVPYRLSRSHPAVVAGAEGLAVRDGNIEILRESAEKLELV
jgi:hypothetical protein